MPSTDPVSSITNCYRLIVSYTDSASSSRNAQLSKLDLVFQVPWFCPFIIQLVPSVPLVVFLLALKTRW